MCDVLTTVVCCSESTEYFPGMASKCFSKAFVAIPVAPVTTDIFTHFIFHISCNSIHKLLYFSFFSASFCMTFLSADTATSIRMHAFSFIISGLFAVPSLLVNYYYYYYYYYYCWV